jgi:hypothetical protein
LEAKLADLPLWISTDQAERLKAALESQGFSDVTLVRGPHGGEIVATASDRDQTFNVRAENPIDLEVIVPRFLKWRDHRNG